MHLLHIIFYFIFFKLTPRLFFFFWGQVSLRAQQSSLRAQQSLWIFFFLIYFFLRWVFVAVRGLSLVAASGGYSSLQCAGFSLPWLLLLRSKGSRCIGSVVVVHGLCGSAACGIFPDQGSNPCPLHWQADSQPPYHQGSCAHCFLIKDSYLCDFVL